MIDIVRAVWITGGNGSRHGVISALYPVRVLYRVFIQIQGDGGRQILTIYEYRRIPAVRIGGKETDPPVNRVEVHQTVQLLRQLLRQEGIDVLPVNAEWTYLFRNLCIDLADGVMRSLVQNPEQKGVCRMLRIINRSHRIILPADIGFGIDLDIIQDDLGQLCLAKRLAGDCFDGLLSLGNSNIQIKIFRKLRNIDELELVKPIPECFG